MRRRRTRAEREPVIEAFLAASREGHQIRDVVRSMAETFDLTLRQARYDGQEAVRRLAAEGEKIRRGERECEDVAVSAGRFEWCFREALKNDDAQAALRAEHLRCRLVAAYGEQRRGQLEKDDARIKGRLRDQQNFEWHAVNRRIMRLEAQEYFDEVEAAEDAGLDAEDAGGDAGDAGSSDARNGYDAACDDSYRALSHNDEPRGGAASGYDVDGASRYHAEGASGYDADGRNIIPSGNGEGGRRARLSRQAEEHLRKWIGKRANEPDEKFRARVRRKIYFDGYAMCQSFIARPRNPKPPEVERRLAVLIGWRLAGFSRELCLQTYRRRFKLTKKKAENEYQACRWRLAYEGEMIQRGMWTAPQLAEAVSRRDRLVELCHKASDYRGILAVEADRCRLLGLFPKDQLGPFHDGEELNKLAEKQLDELDPAGKGCGFLTRDDLTLLREVQRRKARGP